MCFFFFFSSRRRHTRSDRDWSSDVCSSDLGVVSSSSKLGRSDQCAGVGIPIKPPLTPPRTTPSRKNTNRGFLDVQSSCFRQCRGLERRTLADRVLALCPRVYRKRDHRAVRRT